MHWRRKWQPTPVFLPGESQGRGSLVGCRLWGHIESDMTEATYPGAAREAPCVARGAIRHLLHRAALAAGIRAPSIPAAAAPGALGSLAAFRGPAQLAR